MKRYFIWILVFGSLFILSMDFWAWENQDTPSWLGFPSRVWYFAALQLAFAVAFYLFARSVWKDNSPEDLSS
ncbi:MAG: hypothetical protein ACRBF0_12980 [Calditrichia bacterium]